MSHWNFNRETIVSPRLSLAIIPANHENTTLRFAAGLYYQAPFFKELRDTSTVNGITIASLNKKIKSQRSIHFIAGYDYRFKLETNAINSLPKPITRLWAIWFLIRLVT